MKLSNELDSMLTNIEAKLDLLLDKEGLEIMKDIYFDIIYDFYTSNKYVIMHDWDPPYDNSGMLINKYEHFNLNHYETIGDFLDEYTGESRATYDSGCGLYYPDFSDYYRDKIEEKLCGVVYEFMATINTDIFENMVVESGWQKEYDRAKNSDDGYEIQDIVIEVADYYGFTSKAIDRREEIMKVVELEDFRYWHDTLGESVRKKVFEDEELERQKYESNQLRISKEKQEFSVMWERLEMIYYNNYKEKIPKRIEAPQFPEFLNFLQKNGIKGYDFELIINYAQISFSNSVVGKLRTIASTSKFEPEDA